MRLPPIPEYVRERVIGWNGDDGRRWLDEVPGTAERLLDQWGLRPTGEPFEGGSHSYVLPVDRDGEAAVLKVIYRDDENAAEPTALRDFDGDGAIRLYEYDAETGGMLLERAMPGTQMVRWDFDAGAAPDTWRRRIGIACGLYRRLWRAPGPPEGFPEYPSATDLLKGWAGGFDGLEPQWRAHADDLCRALADPSEVGVANRDSHLGNIIAASREPWLLIDPKPYVAERAFSASYLVFQQLEFAITLGASELVTIVAEGMEADRERVKAWATLRALVEAAEAEPGGYDDPETCLRVADELRRA